MCIAFYEVSHWLSKRFAKILTKYIEIAVEKYKINNFFFCQDFGKKLRNMRNINVFPVTFEVFKSFPEQDW